MVAILLVALVRLVTSLQGLQAKASIQAVTFLSRPWVGRGQEGQEQEDVTWSVLNGGGWRKTHHIMRGRVGAELLESSTMKNAPCASCHIPLKQTREESRPMRKANLIMWPLVVI